MNNVKPFDIKDCTLAAIATGIKAQTLVELRDRLATIPMSSIYFHFWGGRLRIAFEHREYHNDFSNWAHNCLHDDILAERLELLNPTEYQNIEALCADLIEIIDNRIDEGEFIPVTKREEQFHFIQSKIVVFQTRYKIERPSDLIRTLPLLTKSSIFYHFIDSARRMPIKTNDFSAWLEQFGSQYQPIIDALKKIDPFLISLTQLQNKLIDITTHYLKEADHVGTV